jgi:phenylpropionate dioxygenase-like ring-hydroxylating dioxygenase large terminal subunit
MVRESIGWFPVARAAEVGTTPVPVGAGGSAFVVVWLRPGGEVTAFPARCPHRLVPLAPPELVRPFLGVSRARPVP